MRQIKDLKILSAKAIFTFLVVLWVLPFAVLAQNEPAQVEPTGPNQPGLICKFFVPAAKDGFLTNQSAGVNSKETLSVCVRRIYNFALGISGLIAMGTIVYAGYLYMTAGGDGEQISHAKEMIGAVIAGIIILATAFIVLKFLNPSLVNLKDNPTKLNTPSFNIPSSSSNTVSAQTTVTSPLMLSTVTATIIKFRGNVNTSSGTITSVQYDINGEGTRVGYHTTCNVAQLANPFACNLDSTLFSNGDYNVRLKVNVGNVEFFSPPVSFSVQH